MTQRVPFISCVTTLYCSRAFVREFVERSYAVLSDICHDFEIILVDDGSPDDGLELAKGLLREFPKVRILELSRNFGHHAAILAGLSDARGDLVFFVDSDLEEDPELVRDFARVMQANDRDVIYGYHNHLQQRNWMRRTTSKVFWSTISAMSEEPIMGNIGNVRLMKRAYVDALLSMPDRNLFLGGMFPWPGFRQERVEIQRKPRTGPSSYSWNRRFVLAAKAAIAFSDAPLKFVFALGTAIALVAGAVGIYFTALKILAPDVVQSGFTALIVSVWLVGGLIMGSIGILGLYIAHLYNQTRQRPRFIIRQRHEAADQE